MDPSQINRLKEEHQKGLQFCKENIAKWEKFKDDYEALKQRLETLPDCLSYDVTVPFGSNAFVKGKLVHTNEIMVLLGENWFAEVSAKQAAGITTRRIAQCEKMLEDFYKEKEQFENWLSYIYEVSGNGEVVEIVEHWDEEKLKSWREQHAKNMKSMRLAEKKKEKDSPNSDEYYFRKLDELAITETNGYEDSEENGDCSKSELDSTWAESVESVSTIDAMEDGCSSEDQSEKPSLKLHLNNKFWKTSESETGDDCEDNHKNDANANGQEIVSPKSEKHVRWQDLSSKQNIKKITFRHSKAKKQNSVSNKYKVIDYSEDENHPLIQSPSDIYKQFGNFFQSSPPKSILKVKTPSPSIDMNEPFFPTKDVAKESSPETDENTNSHPFTGEVRERSCPINIIETKSSRPTSHFKHSRKNRRR